MDWILLMRALRDSDSLMPRWLTCTFQPVARFTKSFPFKLSVAQARAASRSSLAS